MIGIREIVPLLIRWVKNWLVPGAVILLYHRVIALPADPYLLCVTPEHFAEHLVVLRKHGRPMALGQLVRALQQGRVPRRAIVLTFDDGYDDNLYAAKPLLERHDVPATVFVTSQWMNQEQEFWWDELEKILLQSGPLPASLCLSAGGRRFQWESGERVDLNSSQWDHQYRSWNYGDPHNPTPRHRLFRAVYELMHSLSQNERAEVLQELRRWSGTDPLQPRVTHRTLSASEVVRLADGGLVEIGAHTVTHAVLAKLPVATQREEIQRNKADLEAVLGREVKAFAYPHGRECDYSAATVAMVREAGFTCACSASMNVVQQSADLHQLPRMVARDEGGDALGRRLASIFGK